MTRKLSLTLLALTVAPRSARRRVRRDGRDDGVPGVTPTTFLLGAPRR